jgi:hypothetical protein
VLKRLMFLLLTLMIFVCLAGTKSNPVTQIVGGTEAHAMPPILRSYKFHPMPMFARKYGVPCETCHTTIPRLNEVGYKFRAAGFRFPEQIGKAEEKKFDLGDTISARIQVRYDTQVTNQPNGAAVANVIGGVPGPRTTTNALSFMEGTIYPLTSSWGKYFSSLTEFSFSPEDVWEIENAYARFNYGSADRFFSLRGGVFHPWEGFGASDRPFSNVRPLFQTSAISAGGRAVPYVFQPWGLDEVGVEAGADIKKLSFRAAILGGTFMRWEDESKAFIPFPAQTGPWKGANQAIAALGKPFDSLGHSTPDFSAIATYILHPNSGGISVLYYRGNIATPTSCTDGTAIGQTNATTGEVCGVTAASSASPFGTVGNTDFDFSSNSAFRNNFDRYGVYASYPLGKHFLPQGGFNYGRDTNANGSKFDSKGAFAEGAYTINEFVTAGVRYDWFKPRYPGLNSQWAITPYVNIPLQNGFQFIAEYQHRDFQLNASNNRQNDTLQIRFILIK